MRKKLWICLALLFVIPGLLFTASCAKKTVKSDSSMTQLSPEQLQAKQDEAQRMKDQAKQAELEKQRALEEARLKEQRLREKQLADQRRQAEIAKRMTDAKKENLSQRAHPFRL